MIDRLSLSGFDWDEGNLEKCVAHGMTVAEIESVFALEPLVGPDPFPAVIETRWRAFGMTKEGRPAFIVFTLRQLAEQTLVRPISARYMHKKEVQKYEQG